MVKAHRVVLHVRLPRELAKRLKERAGREERSVTALVTRLIRAALTKGGRT